MDRIFTGIYEEETRSYREATNKATEDLRKACEELSGMSLHRQSHLLFPEVTAFVCGGFEKYLPNTVRVNAFRTFDPEGGRQGNFLYPRFADLDWTFIVGVVLSLAVLLLTYDGVCGEREDGTLRLATSYPVSRSALILGKYLGTMAVVTAAFLLGIMIDLAIVNTDPLIRLDAGGWLRVGLALCASLAFLSCFALMGLAVSALVRQSSTSLVALLFLWVAFCLLIPNVAGMLTGKIYPIPRRMAVNDQVNRARQDAVKDAPDGTWSYNGGNPFMPNHELRADAVTKQLVAEMKIRNNYWNQSVRQAERARGIARLSPAGAYTYLCEAVSGTGMNRLIALRRDLRIYKDILHQFVRERDADDPKSPHWINPTHGLFFSKKPVAFEEAPQYGSSEPSQGQSLNAALWDLGILGIFNVLLFAIAYIAFVRYDVR